MTSTASIAHVVPVAPTRGVLRPLGLDEVRITGGFWAQRQSVNRATTLDHIEHWLEREGWLANFDLAAAGALPAGRRGREFSDSEIYKYLEALAWELGRSGPDPRLEARFRTIVDRVGAAQDEDGYLSTSFGRPGQPARWSDLEWGHELYCLGHLFQAAVARERTAPGADDGLTAIARRAADLVCDVFGPDGIPFVCGHPEVEVGLAELGRALDERRYLDQAALFVERRGHGVLRDIAWGSAYFQDDVPVRDAEVLRGHAVRANYLAAGAVDVAVERDDAALLDALRRQWRHTVERRTYLTGGQGSHHEDEAFGDDFELPADRAYSETCAGVGSIMFSWRLLLAGGDPAYADLVERTLFNVVATSAASTGDAFFYANTLHQRRAGGDHGHDEVSARASSSLRAPWFEVSCCPPNVARTFASLAAYVATTSDAGVQLHQYMPAAIDTTLPNGEVVALDVETDYPADGRVTVRVRRSADAPWTLTLRVPAWAGGARLEVSAGGVDETRDAAPGTVEVARRFEEGDVVTLVLPMAPRFTSPDPRIDAVRGCVAVERGPEVYCVESPDLAAAGFEIDTVRVDRSVPPRATGDGVEVAVSGLVPPEPAWPYRAGEPGTDAGARPPSERSPQVVRLVPYHSWGERGPSTMRVWIPALDR